MECPQAPSATEQQSSAAERMADLPEERELVGRRQLRGVGVTDLLGNRRGRVISQLVDIVIMCKALCMNIDNNYIMIYS